MMRGCRGFFLFVALTGHAFAETYYRSFTREPETAAAFAKMGIPNRCFFAANTLNSLGGAYCAYEPIWEGVGRYNWAAFDRQVSDVRQARADGRFICMVDLNTGASVYFKGLLRQEGVPEASGRLTRR